MSSRVPDGWSVTSLESNAKLVTDGSHLSPPTKANGKPIATVQNMKSRYIDIPSCRLISDMDFEDLVKGNSSPEYGDVLFSKDGTVGKTFVFNQRDSVVLLSSIAIIRLQSDKMVPEYCTQYLKSPFFYETLENTKSGSAIKRIVLKDLKKLKLPTPPLPEQKKIASILTSVDEVIEKTESQIAKLKDLKTGMMQELLTKGVGHTEFKDSLAGRIPVRWKAARLEELLADIPAPMRSGPFGSALLKHELVPEGIPFLGIDNVHVERFHKSYKRFVTPQKFDQLSRYAVKEKDVMVTIMGTVGRCCVVPEGIGKALSSKHVWTISLDTKEYVPELLCWQTNYSEWVKRQFKDESQGGVMDSISSKTLKNLILPVPPMEEQLSIAKIHCALTDNINQKTTKKGSLTILKKALMQDLLTGNVRVKVGD